MVRFLLTERPIAMNVYIIKHATGEILSVNRTVHGCATELYGLDVEIHEEELQKALASSPSTTCKTSEGVTIVVERHYLSN
tara:strand:- start:549 stop:791 length:243 start_codon:yes stop_codon:yes gene_type:complete